MTSMSNIARDLTPRFPDEIDADVIDVATYTVGTNGYAGVDSKYAHHLVAWAPLRNQGQIKTTTYNQNKKKQVQSYVQSEGGVNIGTEEWIGERIVILVLDEMLEDK